jgi:ABC-type amino acid transport substrate-binding protein
MSRVVAVGAVAAVAGVLAASCASTAPQAAAKSTATNSNGFQPPDTWNVAMTQANPPFNYINSSHQLVGYDVDVTNELAKRLGVKHVNFLVGTFQNFIPGVVADRFDLVVAGQTITPARLQQVDFTAPYEVNGVAIFVAQSNTTIKALSDLNGKTIAVTAGGTQADYVAKNIPTATAKTYANITLALTDVADGRADASLASRFTGADIARNSAISVKPLSDLLNTEVNGISFRKNQPQLKAALDSALAAMISDGTLTSISEKWLGVDMAAELHQYATK